MNDNNTRILIAENDPMTRDMLSLRLDEAGYPHNSARDGHEAMELARQQDFALILLDYQMPGINGRDVLRILRAQLSEMQLPVIMMLEPGEEKLVPALLALGANDTVLKPLKLAEVIARVTKQLRHCRQLAEAEQEIARQKQYLAEQIRLLAQEKQLLEHNRKRLKKLIDASPSIVYAARASGNFNCVFISDRLHGIMGYWPAEMINTENFWFDHIHPEDETRVTREFLECLQRGRGRITYRFRHRDGHYLRVEDDFELLHDEYGQPQEIIGAWSDVSQIEPRPEDPWLEPTND